MKHEMKLFLISGTDSEVKPFNDVYATSYTHYSFMSYRRKMKGKGRSIVFM